jgi:exodeoxyribonuclease VII large subunit
MAAKLGALSPLNILDRGYALVFDASGTLVTDATKLQPGQEISARVARGSFTAEVKKTE